MKGDDERIFWSVVALLLAVPAAHPLLIPFVGVPSHLLWWVHVLPVAMVAFRYGRRGGAGLWAVSAILVVVGELAFGAGYGQAADWATVGSLAVALGFTNLLVGGFALYARAHARRYQVLFDTAANGIIRTDAGLRVEAANSEALDLLGLSGDEIRGRRMDEIPPLSGLPPPPELEEAGWTGSLCVGPEGQEAEVHLMVAAVSHDDPPGYQLVLVDRTDEVVQEREMERQSRLATLGEALAGVAHELNNPLAVITAWSSMALDSESDPEERREALETIGDQARRMEDLVGELLGYSRVREDDEKVQVDQVVERLVRMQRVARGKGVRIDEEVEWRGEAAVSGAKLEQILVNLLTNAADATPRGTGRIALTLRKENGDLVIRVSDNGPGISPGVAQRIFDPFVTTKPEGEGTGLGLAISRRLAASMGGSLTAGEGELGGACFTLRLPERVQGDPSKVVSGAQEVEA